MWIDRVCQVLLQMGSPIKTCLFVNNLRVNTLAQELTVEVQRLGSNVDLHSPCQKRSDELKTMGPREIQKAN